jgi:hypothetical protein
MDGRATLLKSGGKRTRTKIRRGQSPVRSATAGRARYARDSALPAIIISKGRSFGKDWSTSADFRPQAQENFGRSLTLGRTKLLKNSDSLLVNQRFPVAWLTPSESFIALGGRGSYPRDLILASISSMSSHGMDFLCLFRSRLAALHR